MTPVEARKRAQDIRKYAKEARKHLFVQANLRPFEKKAEAVRK
jgi:hypothetical protein